MDFDLDKDYHRKTPEAASLATTLTREHNVLFPPRQQYSDRDNYLTSLNVH